VFDVRVEREETDASEGGGRRRGRALNLPLPSSFLPPRAHHTGASFPDYNVREYIRRRARDQFRAGVAGGDAAALQPLLTRATEELAVWRKQAAVYGLYHRPQRSIMEVEGGKGGGGGR